MKGFLKAALGVVIVIALAAVGLVVWLSVAEYKPAPVEELRLFTQDESSPAISSEGTISLMTWNIGYGGLGDNADFFMDGGKSVKSTDEERVNENLEGIRSALYVGDSPDFILLQEVDSDSHRTYGIDERPALSSGNLAYALNHSCPFVPYPLPPIGKVNAGVFTTTDYETLSAQRISLPCPFSWPVSAANLKRCLLVSRHPIEGSDKQLVIVNLHLEAYDDGEGKLAQTEQLNEFIKSEYEKGNYVIAGGDFNQVFPGTTDLYPNAHPDLWEPGVLSEDSLPEGWSYAYDPSTPTCRLLNQPYAPADEGTQHFVIDGFILSPNVTLESVETIDIGFKYSDHNPVLLKITLN